MRWVVLASLLFARPLLLAAADPSSAPDAAEVRQLVRQLESSELASRDGAEQSLIALGPGVLEMLPKQSDRQGAELAQRLTRIRDRLERQRDHGFAEGTKVTLVGDFPLKSAFAEIEKQTGNRIVDFREQFGQETTDPTLKLDLTAVPFWQALDQVLDQAGLITYPYGEHQALSIVAAERPDALRLQNADYVGAFRIEGAKVIADRDLREPRKHTLTLTLEVQWEPRLRPITLIQAMSDVQAKDDKGATVEVATPEAKFEAPVTPGNAAVELQLPLIPPDRQATMIESLSGRLTALLPGGEETFEFAKLGEKPNVEQRRGGALVTLEQVRKNNDLWEVRVLVRYDDPAGTLESHRSWIFNNAAYLRTASGEELQPDGFETTRQTETEVGVAYFFDVKDVAGATFVYRTPTVLMRMPLEYHLKDLPLP